MNRKQTLRRELGERYRYERFLSHGALQRLRERPPESFSEAVVAALAVGYVRLSVVAFRSFSSVLLGYDVFVRDAPEAAEWIFYDSLPEPVRLREAEMLRVLDAFVEARGLSYTECCFARLDGKHVEKSKNAPPRGAL